MIWSSSPLMRVQRDSQGAYRLQIDTNQHTFILPTIRRSNSFFLSKTFILKSDRGYYASSPNINLRRAFVNIYINWPEGSGEIEF